MSKVRICYLADMAHHYRAPIFRVMADKFGCEFFFGDKSSSVKAFDANTLPGFRGRLRYIRILGALHYLVGGISKALSYDKIILLGDPHGIHNWIICLLGRVLGKEIYLWTHGWYGNETIIKGFFKMAFFRLASKILVYGNRSKELLVSKGFSSDRVAVIFNSLDYDRQVSVRSKFRSTSFCNEHFNNANPVIVYIGRVQKIKRLDLLVQAVQKLNKNGFPVNFVVIGSLDGDSSIQKMVSRCGLDELVWFYGPCYDEENICKIISSSDICVSPGNVGLTAIHSLTYGCPVITHNKFFKQMPEVESIVPGETGDFFYFGDVNDLAEKIKIWAKKRKENRVAISERCYAEVEKFWNPRVQLNMICDALEIGNDYSTKG